MLARSTVTLAIDGVLITTTRTDVKPFLSPERFGYDVAYYYQTGHIYPPGELTVGKHQLTATEYSDGKRSFTASINFTVDAAGTGACI